MPAAHRGRLHPLNQCLQAPTHVVGWQMHAAAVTREHPLEAIVDELRERASLLAPGIPVHLAESDEIAARLAPGERIASEEKSIIEQINDAATGVAGDRN